LVIFTALLNCLYTMAMTNFVVRSTLNSKMAMVYAGFEVLRDDYRVRC